MHQSGLCQSTLMLSRYLTSSTILVSSTQNIIETIEILERTIGASYWLSRSPRLPVLPCSGETKTPTLVVASCTEPQVIQHKSSNSRPRDHTIQCGRPSRSSACYWHISQLSTPLLSRTDSKRTKKHASSRPQNIRERNWHFTSR